MSITSKITLNAVSKIFKVKSTAARQLAKATVKAVKVAYPELKATTKYLPTGTEITRYGYKTGCPWDLVKSIKIGSGNRLAKEFGMEGFTITTWSDGSKKMIHILDKEGKSLFPIVMSPKLFGEYINKFLRPLKQAGEEMLKKSI